jgi:hypothetical protein
MKAALRLLAGGIGSRPLAVLGLAALATWPLEALADALGWDAMHPGNLAAELAWMLPGLACQLWLLGFFGSLRDAGKPRPRLSARLLASAFGAEFLLALRFCVVVLLSALPALACLALFGLESWPARISVGCLALAGAVPSVLYALRRIFAPAVVLWQGLNASQALAESARLSHGRLKAVLWPLLLLNGFALILEGISGAAPYLAYLCMPLSFLLSQAVLAWAYRILTL